ncbi:MAG: hypothetical protein J6K43_05105 [Lachnospiraceae bacterium]|nr:hypothetical protein [Lachnospiraceae bacterium]
MVTAYTYDGYNNRIGKTRTEFKLPICMIIETA